jgi:hypothetical protein
MVAFLTDFSGGFAYYALAINVVSLTLLWFSVRELRYQIRAKRSRPAAWYSATACLPYDIRDRAGLSRGVET